MDKREYLRVVQVGNTIECRRGILHYTDFELTRPMIVRKIAARIATRKWISPKLNNPVFQFGPKFFTKLSLMPSIAVDVRESRSSIRRTCYGFREKLTGERVYLRIEPGGIAEFRDSPCGYLLGTKYLIPNIDRMKEPRWDKVSRLLTRLLTKKGIIVDAAAIAKWKRSTKPRVKLAKRIVMLRMAIVVERERDARREQRIKDEEANKSLSGRRRVLRKSNSSRSARSKFKRGSARRANHEPGDFVHTYEGYALSERARRRVDAARGSL